MLVASFSFDNSFDFEEPKILWEGDFLDIGGWSYDITLDSKYFLMKQNVEKKNSSTNIEIITNLLEEVNQKGVDYKS